MAVCVLVLIFLIPQCDDRRLSDLFQLQHWLNILCICFRDFDFMASRRECGTVVGTGTTAAGMAVTIVTVLAGKGRARRKDTVAGRLLGILNSHQDPGRNRIAHSGPPLQWRALPTGSLLPLRTQSSLPLWVQSVNRENAQPRPGSLELQIHSPMP